VCDAERVVVVGMCECASAEGNGLWTERNKCNILTPVAGGLKIFDRPRSNVIGVSSYNVFIGVNAGQVIAIDKARHWDRTTRAGGVGD
jgi:hypothetical protein